MTQIEIIADVVCSHFGQSLQDVRGKCRERDLVDCRAFIAYYARTLTDLSLKKIGMFLLKDHSSVVHYCANIPDLIRFNGYQKHDQKLRGELALRLLQADLEWTRSIAQL